MDKEDFPIEDIIQYTDQYGTVYVSLNPDSNPDYKKFIEDTVNSQGIISATIMYPYVPLVMIDRVLVPTVPKTEYDPKITNYFHIMKAKNSDELYSLSLKHIYSTDTKEEPKIVSLNAANSIMNPNEGISITPNDQRSEEPIVIPSVKNWHPNKDANGNYLSAQQINTNNAINAAIASSPYYGQSYLAAPMAMQYPF
jgi:hypothetical protein